jgi:hypothetical protein
MDWRGETGCLLPGAFALALWLLMTPFTNPTATAIHQAATHILDVELLHIVLLRLAGEAGHVAALVVAHLLCCFAVQ